MSASNFLNDNILKKDLTKKGDVKHFIHKSNVCLYMEKYLQHHKESKSFEFKQTDWMACSEDLPTVEKNGLKVLIYRIMNDSQESLAFSIYETSMVKHCNINETWWMELPKPPNL